MSRGLTMVDPFPLPHSELPGLRPLLNGGLWDTWSRQGRVFPAADPIRHVRYVRLKIGTSCRLVLFSGEELWPGLPEAWQIRLFPDEERARAAYEKLADRKPWDERDVRRPFLDTAHAAVGAPFPVDDELPTLRHCFRSHRFREALLEAIPGLVGDRLSRRALRPRLLAYKPGRRAVLRVDLVARGSGGAQPPDPIVVKIVKPEALAPLTRRLRAVDARILETGGRSYPSVRGEHADRAFVACGWRSGVPLRRTGPPAPETLRTLETLGEELARLHASRGDDPTGLPPAVSRRSLDELAGDFGALWPAGSERFARLAERLDALDRARRPGPTLIHGDLHLGQILDDGGSPALIDWDQAGTGDPFRDLGGLAAHGEVSGAPERYRDAFVAGYEREAGSIDEDALRFWTARALFQRLGEPFRRLRTDWPREMEALLDRAEGALP